MFLKKLIKSCPKKLLKIKVFGLSSDTRTIKKGDLLFLINNKNNKKLYDLSKQEAETRRRKVEILSKLVDSGSDSEFRLLDERLALIDAQKRLDLADLNLKFSMIKSEITGTISKVNVGNIGQVVQPGATLAEIVPQDDILKIEAAIMPKDIAYVRQGQKAKLGFTAYDIAIYGQIEGKVVKIAANTTSTEDGGSFYQAMIEVNTSEIKDQNDIILQPGMIADVSIIGEERTVLSYILNPITKLSKRALQE